MEKNLVIWLEGQEDLIFFENIIRKKFERNEFKVTFNIYKGDEYKNKSNSALISKQINSFSSMENFDYIFVHDCDKFKSFDDVKNDIQSYISNIDKSKITVVKKVIEGWYLAGVTDSCCKEWKIQNLKQTNTLTKNRFKGMMPKIFGNSKRDFMKEITKIYDDNVAIQKNISYLMFSDDYF